MPEPSEKNINPEVKEGPEANSYDSETVRRNAQEAKKEEEKNPETIGALREKLQDIYESRPAKAIRRTTWGLTKGVGGAAVGGAAIGAKEAALAPFYLLRGGFRTAKLFVGGMRRALKGGYSFGQAWEEAKKEFHLKSDEYGGFWKMVFDISKKKEDKK